MEIRGDLALQTKIKWPLSEDDLARLFHSLCESRDGMEADVTKLLLGYKKTKYGNLSFKNILPEWKLVPRMKHNLLLEDHSYQIQCCFSLLIKMWHCRASEDWGAGEKSDKSIVRKAWAWSRAGIEDTWLQFLFLPQMTFMRSNIFFFFRSFLLLQHQVYNASGLLWLIWVLMLGGRIYQENAVPKLGWRPLCATGKQMANNTLRREPASTGLWLWSSTWWDRGVLGDFSPSQPCW